MHCSGEPRATQLSRSSREKMIGCVVGLQEALRLVQSGLLVSR